MHGHNSLTGGAFFLLIPQLICICVFILYMAAVFKNNRTKKRWNPWRSMSFGLGLFLCCVAMHPSFVAYAHHSLSGHMYQHLLIGMLAPIGLVMGAPITLALSTLPADAARFLSAILRSKIFHLLSHPVTALVLNIGGMFLLYVTSLYAASQHYALLHHFIHFHFLAAGYLFTWSIVGPDPAPKRPGFRLRLYVLFISAAAHAYLGKAMYAYLWPQGTLHSAQEIMAAAKIMYYGGDIAELLLIIIFFTIWYQKQGRPYYMINNALSIRISNE